MFSYSGDLSAALGDSRPYVAERTPAISWSCRRPGRRNVQQTTENREDKNRMHSEVGKVGARNSPRTTNRSRARNGTADSRPFPLFVDGASDLRLNHAKLSSLSRISLQTILRAQALLWSVCASKVRHRPAALANNLLRHQVIVIVVVGNDERGDVRELQGKNA